MVIRAHWMFFLMLTALPVAHQDAAHARETAAPRYWELDDTKDPMTDRITRSVGSDVVFADGRLVQVSAVCDDLVGDLLSFTQREQACGLVNLGAGQNNRSNRTAAWRPARM